MDFASHIPIIEEPGQSSSSNATSSAAPIQSQEYIDNILKLSILREEGKLELIEIVQSLRGRKCLVLEPQLGGLLNLIIQEGSRVLKENGVQYFRELKGELGDFVSESTGRDIPENIVYLVRPNLSLMKVIAKQVHAYLKSGQGTRCQFHIYFVPHRTVVCEQMLEDEGVLEYVEIGEYHLGLVPFENDMLSLELDGVFRQCYVDGDTSSLTAVARALARVQNVYGIIPNIKSKGAASRKVLQKMFHFRREEEIANQASNSESQRISLKHEIDTLVLFDREVDLTSAMATPLTYEGLVDEIIGIENGRVKLDSVLVGDDKEDPMNILNPNKSSAGRPGAGVGAGASSNPNTTTAVAAAALAASKNSSKPNDKVVVNLNSSDAIYDEVRDISIERLGYIFQDKAKNIKERYENFRGNKDASITEIHDFVKKIPNLTKEFKQVQKHINIAELLKCTTDSREFRDMWQLERGILEGEVYLEQLEDIVCADTDGSNYWKVLRLLCLQSLTAGGIRSSKYEAIKRLFVQCYGYDQVFTLSNLEKAGFLKRKDLAIVEGPSVWQGLRKQLKLINENSTAAKADDVSYVAAGFAPVLARLLQCLPAINGWSSIAEVMRLLPGPLLELTQTAVAEELSEMLNRPSESVAPSGGDDGRASNKKVMMVFVVGGLTFLEVAAFRFLSKDPHFPFQIIMATTKFVNGSTLLKSLKHDLK